MYLTWHTEFVCSAWSQITFDEEDEIGEYETDEDEEQDERAAPPSKAMALLNHARHAVRCF